MNEQKEIIEPYEKEERRFRKFQKINNYYFPKLKCCANCLFSSKTCIESELLCNGDKKPYIYNVHSADEMACCDLWEEGIK